MKKSNATCSDFVKVYFDVGGRASWDGLITVACLEVAAVEQEGMSA